MSFFCLKIEGAYSRLESFLFRKAYNFFPYKPSSFPFLSGDTFRSICNHVYEEKTMNSFSFDDVREGDLIFCESRLIKIFFADARIKIKRPFILLSGNGDQNIDSSYLPLIPENLIIWFAQNIAISHQKVRPLPIGLENAALHWHGIVGDFKKIRGSLPVKKPRILFGFTIGTNAMEREPAFKVLINHPASDRLSPINTKAYKRILANYSFVASPPGNGLDCHRTWEALYLNVIPIVKKSIMTESFERELPLWLIDDWRELETYDENGLQEKYDTIWNGSWNRDALWLPYWQKMINESGKK